VVKFSKTVSITLTLGDERKPDFSTSVSEAEWSLDEWADKIEANFESHFRVFANNPNERRKDLVKEKKGHKDYFTLATQVTEEIISNVVIVAFAMIWSVFLQSVRKNV
jgi:hypothetical protein